MVERVEGIITLAGSSGGAGRSALTLSIAATLAQDGAEVLLVDLDPRGSLSYLVGLDDTDREAGLLEALAPGRDPFTYIIDTGYPGLSILPSDMLGVPQHVQLEAALADWRALPRMLAPLREWYHVILLDVPPGTGRPSRAAIAAADEVLIPLVVDPLAVRSLPHILQAVADARQVSTSRPELAGIFLNRVDPASPFFKQIVDELYARFQPLMLDTGIPADPWFVEAAARAMPLPFLLPEAAGSLAVARLVDELKGRFS